MEAQDSQVLNVSGRMRHASNAALFQPWYLLAALAAGLVSCASPRAEGPVREDCSPVPFIAHAREVTPIASIAAAVDDLDFDMVADEGLIAYIPWQFSDEGPGDPKYMDLTGVPIALPDGHPRHILPRVLARPDGGFDVVWAEADSADGTEDARHLYHATYSNGHGWSKPSRVYSSYRMIWRRSMVSAVRGADGLLRIAVPELRRGVVVLTQTADSTFTADAVPMHGAVYSQIMSEDETMVLAMASDTTDALLRPLGVVNSVFAATWATTAADANVTRIQLSEHGLATNPKLVVTASSETHALWRQHEGTNWPTTLKHWRLSADGTWVFVDDISVPGVIASYDVVADGPDGLLALITVADDRLWSARWRQGWTLQPVLAGRVNGTSRIVRRPDPTAIISVVNCERSGVQLLLARF